MMKQKLLCIIFVASLITGGCKGVPIQQVGEVNSVNSSQSKNVVDPDPSSHSEEVIEVDKINADNISISHLIKRQNADIKETYYWLDNTLKKYPNIKILLDLDSQSTKSDEGQSTKEIGGVRVASITFRTPHSSNFKEGLNFSKEISKKVNELYPDVSGGVLVKNNDVSPSNIVIVRIGNKDSSLDEKKAALNILGVAIKSETED